MIFPNCKGSTPTGGWQCLSVSPNSYHGWLAMQDTLQTPAMGRTEHSRQAHNLVKFICFSAVIEQIYIIPTQAHLGIGIGSLPDPDPVLGSVGPDPVPVGSSD